MGGSGRDADGVGEGGAGSRGVGAGGRCGPPPNSDMSKNE